jgi:hypothetical protein
VVTVCEEAGMGKAVWMFIQKTEVKKVKDDFNKAIAEAERDLLRDSGAPDFRVLILAELRLIREALTAMADQANSKGT